MRTRLISGWAVAIASFVLALATQVAPANATLITGSIGFQGSGTPLDSTNAPVASDVASKLDFGGIAGGGNGFGTNGTVQVGAAEGDLAVLSLLSTGSIKDLTINPATFPVPSFIVVVDGANTYEFWLDTLAITLQNTSAIVLDGQGVLKLTGFDDTPGWYTLSTSQSGTKFTFSAAVNAPEPTTLGLLGAGLAALGIVLRRRRKR